jgi:FdhD protein
MNKSEQAINTEQLQKLTEQATASVKKVVIKNSRRHLINDTVLVEQPLQITIIWTLYEGNNQIEQSQIFSITMRTPGNDKQLILGLLRSEGVIGCFNDVADISSSNQSSINERNDNEWEVCLTAGVVPELSSLERYQMTYSSCGLCGTTSLKSLELKTPPELSEKKHVLAVPDIVLMPNKMREQQSLFKLTGGSHSAALFNGNTLVDIREDIGRHNAVDKLFGALLESKNIKQQHNGDVLACVVSGRVSFEIVQKTVMAGIAILIAVGAPSDLAILAAKRFNLTLLGFTTEHGFNIYHGEWRLLPLEE